MLLVTPRNLAMHEAICNGDVIDLAGYPRNNDGEYVLAIFKSEADYCDSRLERWIWSIGRDLQTGEILAALDGRFYRNPFYECLWLR